VRQQSRSFARGITFHKLIQDTQGVATDPNQNHMISQAFFTLEVGGKQYTDMSVALRQPFGTDYTKEPIEAEKPSFGSYTGNWNHNEFRDAAENYCRSALGMAIGISPGSNVRMRNHMIVLSKSYDFDIPE
jgi:hypothetical protein